MPQLFPVLVVAAVVVVAAASATAATQEADAVRDVFSRVLRLRPQEHSVVPPPPPPRHMLELYHKYASGAASRRGADGNTVRSILPTTGRKGTPSEQLLVFNVSALDSPSEDVRVAQLHLHRGRRCPPSTSPPPQHRPRALAPPCRARLYRLSPSRRPSLLAALPLTPRGGWTTLDVTPVLRELLLTQGPAHVLGVGFEAPAGRAVAPSLFLRDAHASEPAFLVVFSDDLPLPDNWLAEEGDAAAAEYAAPPRAKHTHDVAEMLQAAGADVFAVNATRHRKQRLRDEMRMLDSNALEPRGRNSRIVRRSVEDNELPETEDAASAMARFTPDQLLTAREAAAAETLIPHPSGAGRRGRPGGGGVGRRRKGRGRKQGKKQRKKHDPDEDWLENKAGIETEDANGTCRRHKMVVNFHDIGWSDFIIAPPSFEAFFCAGRCPFPLPSSLGITNHAILQSLVHVINKNNVPAPCCAPASFSDLTLLYHDSTETVTLRRFNKMSVLSCSCQ